MNGYAHRVKINHLPFRIGRDPTCQHAILSGRVSKQHAEIVTAPDGFRIRDLGSTNGTFLNGSAITDGLLKSGDILHFAHKEYRFVVPAAVSDSMYEVNLRTASVTNGQTPQSLIHGADILREILRDRQVHVLFQPIVHLDTQDIVAFETLGR